jgi:hypothetical protein
MAYWGKEREGKSGIMAIDHHDLVRVKRGEGRKCGEYAQHRVRFEIVSSFTFGAGNGGEVQVQVRVHQ